jgi:hypothetical protein
MQKIKLNILICEIRFNPSEGIPLGVELVGEKFNFKPVQVKICQKNPEL